MLLVEGDYLGEDGEGGIIDYNVAFGIGGGFGLIVATRLEGTADSFPIEGEERCVYPIDNGVIYLRGSVAVVCGLGCVEFIYKRLIIMEYIKFSGGGWN